MAYTPLATRWVSGKRALTGAAEKAPSLSGGQVIALLGGIILYHELACRKGELISEVFDRGLDKNAALVTTATVVTAAHLLNALPPRVDPFSWICRLLPNQKESV